MIGDEEIWEKAFQLAFFIICDRSKAYQITQQAMDKLGAQRSREKRRAYWRGRDNKLNIRKISRSEIDILQWLVYLESEELEMQQEQNALQTEVDLVVRYIKHLVQLTTAASSFYVNVGLNRLLRNYSTPEVQQVYELTTDRYPASEEYRKVKGRLMNSLIERFDRYIRIRTSEYREQKFDTYEDQEQWRSVVEACLDAFTPWSSWECCLPDKIGAHIGKPGTGVRLPGGFNDPDKSETSKCHWFIHSPCYGELTRRLHLEPPAERLYVPRFLFEGGGGKHMDQASFIRNAAPLTEPERKKLKHAVEAAATQRQRAPMRRLKIVAHGRICAYLSPAKNDSGQFDISDGTKLLEVHSEMSGTDIVLATHWIDYTEWNGIAAGEYTIALKNRRELLFRIMPAKAESNREGGATVVVESRSASRLPAWLHMIYLEPITWRNLVGYATAALLFTAVGWFTAVAHDRAAANVAAQTGSQHVTIASTNQSTQSAQRQANAALTYLIASGEPNLRGTGHTEETIVTFGPGDRIAILNIAVAADDHHSFRAVLSSFPDEQELLSENALNTAKSENRKVVEFSVPSTVVSDRTHYLVTLYIVDNRGHKTLVSRNLLEVRK